MNAAIGKLLTQFDANGRAKSPPPPPPPKIQDVLTRPMEVRREPQPPRQAQSQPQLQSPLPGTEFLVVVEPGRAFAGWRCA